jgi:hypothetical protein
LDLRFCISNRANWEVGALEHASGRFSICAIWIGRAVLIGGVVSVEKFKEDLVIDNGNAPPGEILLFGLQSLQRIVVLGLGT